MNKSTLLITLTFLLVTCQSAPTAAPVPDQTPTETAPTTAPASMPTNKPSVTSTPMTVISAVPSMPATEIETAPPPKKCALPDAREYTSQFREAIGAVGESCLPDKTQSDIGVYIYDLTNDRELVSINADTPFQFASAFKGPVLVYFLSACRQYWDAESPEWDAYFHNSELVKDDWYTSDEYEKLIREHISDVSNWDNIESFYTNNRVKNNGVDGPIDKRYFILNKVYSMIARSSNPATSDVLQFIYEHCQKQEQSVIEKQKQCSGPNAITAFNAWFYEFSGIKNENDMPHSGLYNWDTILERDSNGTMRETIMTTSGLKDSCVNQFAKLNCMEDGVAVNAMSARELHGFYDVLYHLNDVKIKETALSLLKIDEPSPARGYLKNMARNTGAEAVSKNGNAYFIYGLVTTDAGILRYNGNDYIVVTLSFNAPDAMTSLYGSYTPNGELVGDPGLIQNLIEENRLCAMLDSTH
jgi:hypothetical protein